MAGIPKHKPKTWRENQGAKILKIREEITETEKRLKKEYKKDKLKSGIVDVEIESNMPVLGGPDDPRLAPDGLPKGEHYLHKGKWKPVLEAKHGKLIKGFPKLTKRGWK